MHTTKIPVGEIINSLYKNETFYRDESLLGEVKKLVDLILIRTKKDGVDKTLQSIKNDLFKLRIKITNESHLFENLNGKIQNRIGLQFNETTKYKDLETAFVNSIYIYDQIAESIISKFLEKPSIPQQFEYEDYVGLLKSLPGQESQFILPYLNSSIALDYSLIISELIFDDELKLKKSEIDSLVLLLKNSIEEFAVFSSKFELWKPNDRDENQWIRNIKIRIGLFETTVVR